MTTIEAKWQENPDRADAETMRRVAAKVRQSQTPWRPGRRYVVGTPANAYPICDDVTAISIGDLGILFS